MEILRSPNRRHIDILNEFPDGARTVYFPDGAKLNTSIVRIRLATHPLSTSPGINVLEVSKEALLFSHPLHLAQYLLPPRFGDNTCPNASIHQLRSSIRVCRLMCHKEQCSVSSLPPLECQLACLYLSRVNDNMDWEGGAYPVACLPNATVAARLLTFFPDARPMGVST